MLRHLTPRERTVVCLYFDGDLTQLEIGERMGISQMQVSRILGRSLERLRGLPRALSHPRPEALAA
jgi:RNA polymerase sigma-B factor